MLTIKTEFIPTSNHPGAFGARRKYDIHTGVDLYVQPEMDGYFISMEDCVVLSVIDFTGEKAGSPWWKNTKAVLTTGPDCCMLYGEVEPAPKIVPGYELNRGEFMGWVKSVLSRDKIRDYIPNHSNRMLHFEMYSQLPKEPAVWPLDKDRPAGLIDPTPYLLGKL